MTRKENFWTGFGIGVAAGAAVVLLPQMVGRTANRRIIRLQKSIQIGRPTEEVFAAWTNWDRLPRSSENMCQISQFGEHSYWRVNVGGKEINWTAVTKQFIPNEAIGWKSI